MFDVQIFDINIFLFKFAETYSDNNLIKYYQDQWHKLNEIEEVICSLQYDVVHMKIDITYIKEGE